MDKTKSSEVKKPKKSSDEKVHGDEKSKKKKLIKKKTNSGANDMNGKTIVRRMNSAVSTEAGKRIRVYRNGDVYHKGITVALNPKQMSNMEAFCDVLNEKIDLPHGVKRLYTINGTAVRDLKSIENDKEYVAASSVFTPVAYGRNGLAPAPTKSPIIMKEGSDGGMKKTTHPHPLKSLRRTQSAEPRSASKKVTSDTAKTTKPINHHRSNSRSRNNPLPSPALTSTTVVRKPMAHSPMRRTLPKSESAPLANGTVGPKKKLVKKAKHKKPIVIENNTPAVMPIAVALPPSAPPVEVLAKKSPSPPPRKSSPPQADSDHDSQRSYNKSASSKAGSEHASVKHEHDGSHKSSSRSSSASSSSGSGSGSESGSGSKSSHHSGEHSPKHSHKSSSPAHSRESSAKSKKSTKQH